MRDRILVVGATGMLGAPVARRLLADGWRVRGLVRDPPRARALLGDAIEWVAGDVTQPATLDAAFDGCALLHLNLRGGNTVESYQRVEVEGAAHCIAAARRHRLRRITYLSGSGRGGAALQRHFPVRVKAAVEAALQGSGLEWTSFRATHFMESLPQFVRDGRAAVLGRQPHRLHYVAAADYARMVSRSLELDGAARAALYVHGPEALTMHEALSRYLAAREPGLRAGTLPLPLGRVLAALTGNRDLAFACELFAAFAAIGEDGDPAPANALLGAPATTLDQWLAEVPR
ncbi:MAG: NAD(P)H-binding protein [Steroidobacteraceae bacterium]|nr:NAD(P)H-binding protein [Steroidobacteraceae bacterium]